MKKLKLSRVNKYEGRAEFIIEKSQKFVPLIQKLIKELTKEFDWQLFVGTDGKTGCCIDENIEDWTDRCKHKKYKEYELDIFVGKERIVLVVKASTKNQKRFTDRFMKFCEWKK